MHLTIENYDKNENRIEPKKIILNQALIYTLLKKYLKEV